MEVMELMRQNSILVTKRGKNLLQKTPKMAIFNINLLGKVPKSTHKPLFLYMKKINYF